MLSPELQDAVNHIQSHAHQLRAIITIADAVTSIKALEQAANEAENRKAGIEEWTRKAEADRQSVLAAIHAANVDLDQARKAIAEAKAKAHEDAVKAKAKAEAEAQSIIEEARAGISKAVADEQAKLDMLRAEVTNAKQALGVVVADRIILEEQVADLEARAEKAREYLAKLTREE